jgi:hypothetical protein
VEVYGNMKKVTIYRKEIISLCAVRNMIDKMRTSEDDVIFDFLLENLTPDDFENFERLMERVLRDDKV